MRIRKKWYEFYWNEGHTHWNIHYNIPSDDCDSWNSPQHKGEKPIYRASLTIGFWKMFLLVYLWKVTPFEGSFGMDNNKRYGLTFFERSLHLHWGETKVYWLPWDWEIVRHDLLYPNGDVYWHNKYPRVRLGEKQKNNYSWYEILDGNQSPYPKSDTQVEVAKYVNLEHYTKDGRQQIAKIRLAGEEREWRYRWFKWLPWPRKISRVVDCYSDVELGQRAGSWKGGMMGWSVEWREDESMEGAFWRWYKKWDGN
jgi:hypothetical protein